MTERVGSVRPPIRARKLRGKKGVGAAAQQMEAPQPAAEPAPAAAPGLDPQAIPPGVAAQMMGQNDPAETAALAAKAQVARTAYLEREWSGKHDRRTRRGRIAKTEV